MIRNAALAAIAVLSLHSSPVIAGPLDEMGARAAGAQAQGGWQRWRINVAEKFYREKQYKVAAAEYEKFLKLYEKSEGAPFAQLKWSHCQIELRKQNTAIKDGYQSVIDYFPDSPEAPIAAFLIGRTYRDMGDTKLAKKAYAKATSTYPKHFAAVMARLDQVGIAAKEADLQTETAILRELSFDIERKGPTVQPCQQAAMQLTHLLFRAGDFAEGLKAFATTTAHEENLPANLMHGNLGALPHIVGELTGSTDEAAKKLGEKLADAAAGWLKTHALEGLKDEKRKAKAIQAWYDAAEIRRVARQPDKQKVVYDEMLAALGVDDTLLGRIAQWQKDNKQFDQARTTYAKFKDTLEGRGQIANSYSEERQYDKAAQLYREIAASDTKTVPKWLSAAAIAYRNGNKPDLAIAVYTELLTVDAANADGYQFQMAETLFHAGRWKDSIARYRGTSNFPTNYQRMAQAHRHLKEYNEAIGLYNQIIAASKDHASGALFQIAKTHEEAGKKEDAIKVFKQVCDQYANSGEASQAHAHLNQVYKITVTKGGAKN